MKKRNLGFSHVITTVILTSVMLVIVLTTSFLANSLLNTQIERAQFDQAKNVILALDEIVKKVTFKPQSSGYVRSSFWTTIPYLEETGETLQILVNQTLVLDVPVNIVKIQGGSRVSVAVPEDLTGSESVLLTSVSDSLGRVHVYQSNGSWITLDYSRIRCINSGTSEFFNGTDYEICNLVEIILIKITFGILEVQDKASLTAKNSSCSKKPSRALFSSSSLILGMLALSTNGGVCSAPKLNVRFKADSSRFIVALVAGALIFFLQIGHSPCASKNLLQTLHRYCFLSSMYFWMRGVVICGTLNPSKNSFRFSMHRSARLWDFF